MTSVMIPYSRLLRFAVPVLLLVGLGYFLDWHYIYSSRTKHVKVSYNISPSWRQAISSKMVPEEEVEEEGHRVKWMILQQLPSDFDCQDLASKFKDWKLLILHRDNSKSGCPPGFLSKYKNNSTTNSSLLPDALLFAIAKGAEMIFIASSHFFITNGKLNLPKPDKFYYAKQYRPQDKSLPFLIKHHLCMEGPNFPGPQVMSLNEFYVEPSLVVPVCCCEEETVVSLEKGILIGDLKVTAGLFRSSLFWALPLLWIEEELQMAWSLLVQRIMALTGDQLLIATQSHDALQHKCHEGKCSVNTSLSEKFIRHIAQFSENNSSKVLHYLEKIIEYSGKFIKIKDNPFADWVFKLQKLGWKQVNVSATEWMLPHQSKVITDSNTSVISRHVSPPHVGSDKKQYNISLNQNRICSKQLGIKNCRLSYELYKHTCGKIDHAEVEGREPQDEVPCLRPLHDVLLVVAFNNPHYEALPYVELLYRPWFPNILYCGPSVPDEELLPGLSIYAYHFVSFNGTPTGHPPGSFNYECLILAAEKFDTKGYLLIGDDVLLNVSRLVDLERRQLWFLPKQDVYVSRVSDMARCFMGACDNGRHLIKNSYESEMKSLLRHLHDNPTASPVLRHCHQVLQLLGNQSFYSSYGDIVYIPSRLMGNFTQLAKTFRAHRVFLEAALPNIVRCLEPPSAVLDLTGLAVWDNTRNQPWKHIHKMQKQQLTFLHPTKWGFLPKNHTELVKFYCSNVQSPTCKS